MSESCSFEKWKLELWSEVLVDGLLVATAAKVKASLPRNVQAIELKHIQTFDQLFQYCCSL